MAEDGELRALCRKALDDAWSACQGDRSLHTKLLENLERLQTTIRSAGLEAQLRAERRENLASLAERFVRRFVGTQGYSYAIGTGFKLYDGTHFTEVREDEVIMEVLSLLNRESGLRAWKHKVKLATLKAVRAVSPLDVLPDSPTVQAAINWMCRFLQNREHAKYFLAAVGDLLRGTQDGLTYIADPLLKELVQEMSCQSSIHFRIASPFTAVKFRYRDYAYDATRFVPARADAPTSRVHVEHPVDILAVAAHYSTRYGSADAFLAQSDDASLQRTAHFVVGKTLGDIVQAFASERLERGTGRIGVRRMTFLWKKHLSDVGVHSVGYHDSVHQHLRRHLEFCQDTEVYLGVTSRDLPLVSAFCEFWDAHMAAAPGDELEISEVIKLFLAGSGRTQLASPQNGPTKETIILDMIEHFYPQVEISEDRRAVLGIACSLWPKRDSVVNFIRGRFDESPVPEPDALAIADLYTEYCSACERYVASKGYFENVMIDLM